MNWKLRDVNTLEAKAGGGDVVTVKRVDTQLFEARVGQRKPVQAVTLEDAKSAAEGLVAGESSTGKPRVAKGTRAAAVKAPAASAEVESEG